MNIIVVFVKDPKPGAVKTRLTPFLSHEEAADLYQAFIRDTLASSHLVPGSRTQVAFTPDDAQTSLRRLVQNQDIEWFPQTGESLGDRLRHAFQRAFQAGASRVVVIGSDSPTLPPSMLIRAFETLAHSEVVLGPATDGGYYLIGLACGSAEISRYDVLFEGIAWSTETVYARTIEAVRRAHLSCTELPCWSDVDQPEDLLHLTEQIQEIRDRGDSDLAAHTEQVLKTLQIRIDRATR